MDRQKEHVNASCKKAKDLGVDFIFHNDADEIIFVGEKDYMPKDMLLRDYLYIPLSGNRKGMLKTIRNLIIVMFLGGLWHGAQVTFVLWGLYHGLLLMINHIFRQLITQPITRYTPNINLILS